MATNNKPVAELRIGAVKATVWENDVGGIPRCNVTFSRVYRDGAQWKTTQSFGFSNVLTLAKLADQAHTLIAERNVDAARRAARPTATKARKRPRTFRRRVKTRRLFSWTAVQARGGRDGLGIGHGALIARYKGAHVQKSTTAP